MMRKNEGSRKIKGRPLDGDTRKGLLINKGVNLDRAEGRIIRISMGVGGLDRKRIVYNHGTNQIAKRGGAS